MKPLTLMRAAWLLCATALLYALTASPALAAGSKASHTAHKAAATQQSTKALAAQYGANKKLSLTGGTAVHTSSASMSGSIVRTIVGLLIVIAVIYGLTWVIRQSKGAKSGATGDGLERVASLPLGNNKSVTLVRVGDELHLLGLAENSVNGIRVFSEDEAYELGLPFHGDDDDDFDRGTPPIQKLIDGFRRFTTR